MKKSFLFLSLIATFFFALPEASLAKKKYRYIKREHGVRFDFKLPAEVYPTRQAELSTGGSYTYNWKGRIEVGPYFNLGLNILPSFNISDYSGGLLAEYNFIKNRGKVKFIPALGMSLGAKGGGSTELTLGVHTSMKFFVAKRTPFIVKLEYLAAVPTSFNFSSLSHNVNLMAGFGYYFDFY